MQIGEVISTAIFLIILAALIVTCGGVFHRRNQNWPTILAVAAGIPVFLMLMAGFVGIFLG